VGTYRLYCVDGVVNVTSAEWIVSEYDETAIEAAKDMMDGHPCELWAQSRLVIRLERKR
jgi:electron transfer flavoprotein alpha/beta subunit